MGSTKEWSGINQFPVATQTALHGLLGKVRQQNVDSMTVLVLGKGGVGKSSTVNSIIGERVAAVSAFQSETLRPLFVSRSRAGFTLNIIDTPGLIEGGWVNDQALEIIKRFLMDKTIDVVLYVDRLDGYRVDSLDKQVIRAITRSFGPQIWKLCLLVLTHAQLPPPDGASYDDYVQQRSEGLLAAIRHEAGFKKTDPDIPYALVENSGRCSTNAGGEKILPNGTVWVPNLVGRLVQVVTNEHPSLLVDKKLIEGPNANNRGKLWIPLVLLAQYFLVVRPIRKAIENDIQEETRRKPAWETFVDDYNSLNEINASRRGR
ncbi:hypothetical protein SELMODRAFT_178526 [Selaginella moellendorffii]|uniref:Translocase of chloroplast n=1 Tax=Selaginella moellendorffii TaxID=88036 RepID=D8SC25_SELML|nr:uncharacterized protein LOC9657009 [Selaginella moellendorffii]EFJ18020.1 hypothetical protein SELMODRAFT_178526 [Selaginella moellendorffii]|eukprot:XP_002980835.1 uncharacterized protein LOC9657009 [Selaginella moellendorffii]